MSRRLATAYARIHEAINYRLRTFAEVAGLPTAGRPSIAILLTERCNARCVHCDIWKNRGKEVDPQRRPVEERRCETCGAGSGRSTSSSPAARPC